MKRFARLFTSTLPILVAACAVPDVPVVTESGGEDAPGNAETGAESATGGQDGASAEGAADSGVEATTTEAGPDATVEAGGDGSDASDTGPDGTGPEASAADAGVGAVGVLGSSCSSPGTLACGGYAQKVTLICSGGVWTYTSTCPSGQNCDSTPGSNQGTCAMLDPPCTSVSPGTSVCGSSTTVVQCGPDLVSHSPVQTCTNQACVSGACTGVCTPGATQCSGNGVETCSSSGQWGSTVACPSTTPSCNAGVCGQPTSCQTSGAGLTNCGASSESCCASLEVTGGTYYRTYTNSGSGPTGEADPATVSGFRLDKYLVTVGRFRQFVSAWNGGSGYTPPAGSGKHTHLNGGSGLSATGGGYEPGWVTSDNSNIAPTNANLACDATYGTWTTSVGSNERLPMNCVNWWESYAFCIWDGGFLPSEAEFEYAAAGGSQQREYPWGTAAPGTASQYALYGCYYPSGSASCTGVTNIAPVGTAMAGAGLWGQLDLAGEMYEVMLDWYASSYVDPCTDCAYLTTAAGRVRKGGYFYDTTLLLLLPPYRTNGGPTLRQFQGLRCARTP